MAVVEGGDRKTAASKSLWEICHYRCTLLTFFSLPHCPVDRNVGEIYSRVYWTLLRLEARRSVSEPFEFPSALAYKQQKRVEHFAVFWGMSIYSGFVLFNHFPCHIVILQIQPDVNTPKCTNMKVLWHAIPVTIYALAMEW